MGRKDAVQFTLEWAARARALGATVTFQAGWEGRGNGTSADYEGAVVHHTASPSSAARPNPTLGVLIAGRSDLSGPLCNVTGPWCTVDKPTLHVVSANPANHAGASGGRSMGPLPVTGLFNKRVFGLEIDYAGSSAMTDGQRRAALIFARAVADVLGRSTEYVRAHAETSITGKWDPGYASGKTIDMGAFRQDATNITADSGGFDLSQAQFDQLWQGIVGRLDQEIIPTLRGIIGAASKPFMGFRNDPAQSGGPVLGVGDGTMVLAAPGFWYPVPGAGYPELYQARGLVGPFVNIPPNQFFHLKDLFLAPQSGNVDNGKLAEQLAKTITEAEAAQTAALLQKMGEAVYDASKPVPVPTTTTASPLTSTQLKELAGYLAPLMADEWDRRARDNDSKTGPAS